MRIVAFGASSSSGSINRKLARYAASLIRNAEVEILDLNDYEMPLFSVDLEQKIGQHKVALSFMAKLAAADGLVISFAEHNGSYSTAYKNVLDWCSRIDRAVFQNKPAVLLSASPGPSGAARVLQTAVSAAKHFGAMPKAHLSVPSFADNFDEQNGCLINNELDAQLRTAVSKLVA